MSAKVDRAIAKLDEGVKRLAKSEGRVARANARAVVLRSLRDVRVAVDQDYPTIAKKAKPRAKLNVVQRERRLRKIGWALVRDADMVGALRVAAIVGTKPLQVVADGNPLTRLWLPEWILLAAKKNLTNNQITEMKRSLTARRAFLAVNSLERVA